MVKRWPLLVGALLVTAVNGCSKTQDTAPEQRIFGSPPVINSVSMTSDHNVAHCDITPAVLGKICAGATPFINEIQLTSPTIEIDVGYHQLFFNVGVTDAESTDTASDILLVTVSYTTPPDEGAVEEHSLILLDDGSTTGFPFAQTGGDPEACSINQGANICGCSAAEYTLNSNDATQNDDLFTRGFGWVGGGTNVPSGASFLINNCLARDKHQAPASTSKVLNRTINFKIEATDREGNITEWPARPEATIGPTEFACIGDECACCIMVSNNTTGLPIDGGCKGLPGIIATGPNAGWPIGVGLCETF